MNLKLIECPHCGFKYKTDVPVIVEDGDTVVVRYALFGRDNNSRREAPKSLSIDLKCPNCKKEFEYEVVS